jgi:hypothetical protein
MQTAIGNPATGEAWVMGWLGLAYLDGVQHVTIAGDPDGPLMCGDLLEVKVGGHWLRGKVYYLDGLRAEFRDPMTGHVAAYGGWYWSATAGKWDGNVLLLPGMMARRSVGLYWPEPEHPYEGQSWHRDVGETLVYAEGHWRAAGEVETA